jgi:hypothetical protein
MEDIEKTGVWRLTTGYEITNPMPVNPLSALKQRKNIRYRSK